jgi:hypothetical protein
MIDHHRPSTNVSDSSAGDPQRLKESVQTVDAFWPKRVAIFFSQNKELEFLGFYLDLNGSTLPLPVLESTVTLPVSGSPHPLPVVELMTTRPSTNSVCSLPLPVVQSTVIMPVSGTTHPPPVAELTTTGSPKNSVCSPPLPVA